MIKLDYSLQTPEERNELVKKILAETPEPTERYLEILADYLVLCMEKQEKKERKLLTDNRLATVNKRETSLEGLVSQLENGEDGIYSLITDNKQTIFQPKISITKSDLDDIPDLRQVRSDIKYWEDQLKKAVGKEAYIIKQAIIELRKDQYIIKNAFRKTIVPIKLTRSKPTIKLDDDYSIADQLVVEYSGISLLDPKIISIILNNYSDLKEQAYGEFNDLWCLMEDMDDLCGRALKNYPLYERIAQYKIDGMSNTAIQSAIEKEFDISYSLEYISSLWRRKIPKIIASVAEDDLLDWHYLHKEKGQYKRCSRCHEVKLASNKYFSKNNTSKDGLYSICKQCRNKKGQ